MMKGSKPLIKVCGMRDGDNIRTVEALDVDYIGFIFYPKSPRYVEQAPSYLPERQKRVGVFVNADIDEVLSTAATYGISTIQLHGNESPHICRLLKESGYHVIKAFQISCKEDLTKTFPYQQVCDYLLFDTKSDSYGGTGQSFNWEVLQHYDGDTPFLLSGGIGINTLPALKDFAHPRCAGFDLNSKFEVEPGLKDVLLIQQFMKIISTMY